MLRKLHNFGVNKALRLAFFELHVVIPNICLHPDISMSVSGYDVHAMHQQANLHLQL